MLVNSQKYTIRKICISWNKACNLLQISLYVSGKLLFYLHQLNVKMLAIYM